MMIAELGSMDADEIGFPTGTYEIILPKREFKKLIRLLSRDVSRARRKIRTEKRAKEKNRRHELQNLCS